MPERTTLPTLDPKDLDLPAEPVVTGIEVFDYEDFDGEASYRVLVSIDDDSDLVGAGVENAMKIVEAVQEAIATFDRSRFAYVNFTKPSEAAEAAREE